MTHYITTLPSLLGNVTLASDGDALIGCWFDDQTYDRQGLVDPIQKEDLYCFEEAQEWLMAYFMKAETPGMPLLAPQGTVFQQRVWEMLREIPYGEVVTYGGLAQLYELRYGRAMSAQAIGGAVGRNPISIFIPCHRVVGTNGELTGYAGGVYRKKQLLKLEGVDYLFEATD